MSTKKPKTKVLNTTADQPYATATTTRTRIRTRARSTGSSSVSTSPSDLQPQPTRDQTESVGTQSQRADEQSLPEDQNVLPEPASTAEKVGYKNPPRKTRFKPGQSGNPTGRARKPKLRPGTVLEHLGNEVMEEVTSLLQATVADLKVHPDDMVTTALAKVVVGDGLQKEGAARKFVFANFLEKPLQADQFKPAAPGREEAEIVQTIISAIFDPAITDQEMEEIVKRADTHYETYGEFGARRRKLRRKRRPRRRS